MCHIGTKFKAFLIGGITATSAGLTKEVIDYIDYGTFDIVDMIVTAASGWATSGLMLWANVGDSKEVREFRKAERRRVKLINKSK